ncbi:MAG: S-methyl-5-thioribose-1-phosphate isomerase [Lachnospiraceae bacterium]|nr:S-methyl-5-thioribose-1-phosphate isomerase [Lachnospiraceae bacterium]
MDEKLSLKGIDTVALDEDKNCVVIIDQTLLPGDIRLKSVDDAGDMYDAIKRLEVRGAPAIGVFAAFGMYVLSKQMENKDYDAFISAFREKADFLNSSRPTAVNLSWALKRMKRVAEEDSSLPVPEIVSRLRTEALSIRDEDIEICRGIGEHGLSLLKPGAVLMTHCNAGSLATIRYGTATAPIYLGQEKGYNFRVYCDETRPLLQGARLTAFELSQYGVDTTVLCDNMSASLMAGGSVDAVLVGCDRVAVNGDAANKIGTSLLALAAKHYGVPFYVCAPSSTVDFETAEGKDIPIEMRDPDEVTEMWYSKRMAPKGVKVYNPAFDVTDHSLITGIITEEGVAYPPYTDSLKALLQK